MRILVCGGRYFKEARRLWAFLDKRHVEKPITCIIHGGADGADTLAGAWAREHGIREEAYPVTRAEWAEHGRAAGPIRNRRMLDKGKPDGVVAAPGNKGTADMIDQAEARGLPIRRLR